MGVNTGTGNIRVAEQPLDGSDVLSVFQERSREQMAQRMNRSGLIDAALQERFFESALQNIDFDVASPRGKRYMESALYGR